MRVTFDRYDPIAGDVHVDLATNALVSIVLLDVLDDDWRRRWRLRVDALLEAPCGIEPLVDAGEDGAHRVFEVRRARDATVKRQCAFARVAEGLDWLIARGLRAGPARLDRLNVAGLACDVSAGWPIETAAERRVARREFAQWARVTGRPQRHRAAMEATSAGEQREIDEHDDRAGLVVLACAEEEALRIARSTGRVAMHSGRAPADAGPRMLATRSFVMLGGASSRWSAALALAGSRRHYAVADSAAALVARERAPAYLPRPASPAADPPRAVRLVARARSALDAHRIAQSIRIASRAIALLPEASHARVDAALVKATALRLSVRPRDAQALLEAVLRANEALATCALLVELAEACTDQAQLEQGEAYGRAAWLAARSAAEQQRAQLAIDRARVWRGCDVESGFWRRRAFWAGLGTADAWWPREGYAHARCGALARLERLCDRLEQARWHGRDRRLAALIALAARADPKPPPLIAARLTWLTRGSGREPGDDRAASAPARRLGARGILHAGKAGIVMEILEQLSDLLAGCQAERPDEALLGEAAARLRQSLRARSVAVFVAGRPLPVAGDGRGWNAASPLAARCCEVAQTIAPVRGATPGGGPGAAISIRADGAPIGAAAAAWDARDSVDARRALLLMQATALAMSPVIRRWAISIDAPAAGAADDMPEIIGASAAAGGVRDAVRKVARVTFPVLIEGESGVGKELVARAIHRLSPRHAAPFRALNCAAMAEDLVEAELFGHAQGAFTGAAAARAGLFEDADKGTVFLDEVSELSPRAQAKLLRVLQEGEVRRVGESAPRRVDVRIVAASNRPLREAVAASAFRADLLFRLDVLHVDVPPLRARCDDIHLLCAHFWREASARAGTAASLSFETLGALAAYGWPGNVRELQNVIAALAVAAPRRGRVTPEMLPPHIHAKEGARPTLQEARERLERDLVRGALARAGGKPARAAMELGVSRQGLAKLMRRLGLRVA